MRLSGQIPSIRVVGNVRDLNLGLRTPIARVNSAVHIRGENFIRVFTVSILV